jgi:hypothetical protein
MHSTGSFASSTNCGIHQNVRHQRTGAKGPLTSFEETGRPASGAREMAEGSSSRFDTSAEDLVSLAMEDGFRTTLAALAKHHDNRVGFWLDQIEMDVMHGLKNSAVESVTGAREAAALAVAILEMQEFFEEMRDSLEKE